MFDLGQKNEKEFHELTRDNVRNWNRKFKDLQENFSKNLSDTKEHNQNMRENLDKNYKENVNKVRKTANTDLENYIESTTKDKKDNNFRIRNEKKEILAEAERDRNRLLKSEMEKRSVLKNGAIDRVQENRKLAEKRFLKSRELAEKRFENMNNEVNKRIDEEITERQKINREKRVEQNKMANNEYAEKVDALKRDYNKSLRDLEYRKRAEAISNSKVNKEIEEKYRQNMETQVDLQRETQMRERFDVEKKYSDRLRDTVNSYQNSMREQTIAAGEKVKGIEMELTETNRQDRFEDRQSRERLVHDHRVALNYAQEKGSLSKAESEQDANRKVRALKENFNKSMDRAREQSKKNFEITQQAMHEDKRTLAKRLHEENSKSTANLKKMYNHKIDRLTHGYEKRIQELELQNGLIQQNLEDTITNMTRKTNAEIERQRKAAQESADNRVATERQLGNEKAESLRDKIKNLEASFTQKMNDQTLLHRKRLKTVTFELNQKLKSEANRYQDIIDQNNKFMAREMQRMKVANEADKQRLITQYENRIAQLKKVYNDKTEEVRNFKALNRA